MRAADLAEGFPVVTVDSDALDAARLLAEHRLPGIVVTLEACGGPQVLNSFEPLPRGFVI